jgi:RecB family exonuclease
MSRAAAIVEEDERVAPSGAPFLSHSRINRYLHCPEQYRLYYVERLRPRFPSANLVFGQILHLALAHFFLTGTDPVTRVSEAWDSIRQIDLTYSKRDTWEKLNDSGRALIEKFLAEAMPRIANVAAVERRFELTVTNLDVPLIGVIDLLADLDGKKTIVDFKTSASGLDEHDARLSDQLSAYHLAEPEAEKTALCVLVKTKEPRIEWHLATRSPAQLTEYLAKVEHVGHEIATARFYKRPGMWCSWCDFLPVCLGDTRRIEETLIQVR